MESLIYDSGVSIQQLLDAGFELPIHFAAVSANGSVVAGTYHTSPEDGTFDYQITAETMKQEGMTSPINIMYVDRRGEAALVVLRQSQDEPAPTLPVM